MLFVPGTKSNGIAACVALLYGWNCEELGMCGCADVGV
jgi:hypothetical protein